MVPFWKAFFTLIISWFCYRSAVITESTLMAKYFGAGDIGDCIYFAFSSISFLIIVFSESVILKAFVPRFVAVKQRGLEREELAIFLRSYVAISIYMGIIVVSIMYFVSPLLAKISLHNEEKAALATLLFRLMSPCIIYSMICSYFVSVYQASGLYGWIAFNRLIIMVSGTCGILVASMFFEDRKILAFGMIFGAHLGDAVRIITTYLLTTRVAKMPVGFSLKIKLARSEVVQYLRGYFSIIAGAKIDVVNFWIVMIMVGRQPSAISCVHYADKLFMVVYTLSGTGMSSILTSRYAFVTKNREELSRYMGGVMRFIGMVTIPAAIVAVLSSKQIIWFVYGKNNFPEHLVPKIAMALAFYAVALFPKSFITSALPIYLLEKRLNRLIRFFLCSFIFNLILVLGSKMLFDDYTYTVLAHSLGLWASFVYLSIDLWFLGLLTISFEVIRGIAGTIVCSAVAYYLAAFFISHLNILELMPDIGLFRAPVSLISLMCFYVVFAACLVISRTYKIKDLKTLVW